MAPFLEILTRCYKRPNMLINNIASLQAQTDPDWLQTFIVDDEGLGIGESHLALRDQADKLSGEYVWILDDDDMACHDTLVEELKYIVEKEQPDVIMLRMDHAKRGIKPENGYWGRRPAIAHIGSAAYVVKRELWQMCANAWTTDYFADGLFIQDVFDNATVVYWHDVIASKVQRVSLGAPEL